MSSSNDNTSSNNNDTTKVEDQLEKVEISDKTAAAADQDIDDTPDPSKLQQGLDAKADADSKVEVEQSDPNNPLQSAHTFEELGLKEDLLKGIYSLNYKKPSRIQEVSLPLLLGREPKNLIGQAQSGTGKTACFTLAMLSRIDDTKNVPQALCICPTRELARQIYAVVEAMGKFTNTTIYLASKGTFAKRGDKITNHIVIGTPGTVNNLITKRVLPTKDIKIFVLDEADVMLDQQGLADESIRIKKALPRDCQILLFSATFKDAVRGFALKVVPDPIIIHVKREQLSHSFIKQYWVDCKDEEAKFRILSDLYGTLDISQSIIFVQTRRLAGEIAKRMRDEGHAVSLLHGGAMENEERDRVIDAFRTGTTKVLITTNVLARGIDVPQVSLVINYEMPVDAEGKPDPETYIHRIGRTGRFGHPGVAVNLISNKDDMKVLQYIEAWQTKKIEQAPSDSEQLEAFLKKEL